MAIILMDSLFLLTNAEMDVEIIKNATPIIKNVTDEIKNPTSKIENGNSKIDAHTAQNGKALPKITTKTTTESERNAHARNFLFGTRRNDAGTV